MYKIIPVAPFDLVIFGGTGDLARREILPGLFRRFRVGQLPGESSIICLGRTPLDTAAFRTLVAEAIETHAVTDRHDAGTVAAFLDLVSYQSLDVEDGTAWRDFAAGFRSDRITTYYLSVRPGIFAAIIAGLKAEDLCKPNVRIVLEKPFGSDLDSARDLNRILAASFDESQVYRIDHYLGKETVQNLMALRFANVLFEPLWNSRFIDHIQITVAERTGVAGRGDYYDRSGALRDMVQNHLMQLLCLVAMEPPARFDANAVRDEKLKVIQALLDPGREDIVLGQYADGQGQNSYRQDVGNPDSTTESYVALKCQVANWRWSRTPFYLRTGKRLPRRVSEVVVQFRELPHWIFDESLPGKGNLLTIRLQPDEGIDLRLTIKEPGPGGMRLVAVPLDMSFANTLTSDAAELINAYERLIMDVIRGDQTLFMRSDEIEAAWRWTDTLLATCRAHAAPVQLYSSGSAGPLAANALLDRDGSHWHPLEPSTPAETLLRTP